MDAVRSGAAIGPWRLDGGWPVRLGWAALGLASCALLGLAYLQAARESAPPAAVETVTVVPGDTLWAIASQRYPDADARLKVEQIERLNGLDRPVIVPGQRLRVPER